MTLVFGFIRKWEECHSIQRGGVSMRRVVGPAGSSTATCRHIQWAKVAEFDGPILDRGCGSPMRREQSSANWTAWLGGVRATASATPHFIFSLPFFASCILADCSYPFLPQSSCSVPLLSTDSRVRSAHRNVAAGAQRNLHMVASRAFWAKPA